MAAPPRVFRAARTPPVGDRAHYFFHLFLSLFVCENKKKLGKKRKKKDQTKRVKPASVPDGFRRLVSSSVFLSLPCSSVFSPFPFSPPPFSSPLLHAVHTSLSSDQFLFLPPSFLPSLFFLFLCIFSFLWPFANCCYFL